MINKEFFVVFVGCSFLFFITASALYNYLPWYKLINMKKEKFIRSKDNLSFWRNYTAPGRTHNGSYHSEDRMTKENIESILDRFKKYNSTDNLVFIGSKFNDIYYAVFDLDTIEHLKLFKQLYAANSYALFRSSDDHFWEILDLPYKNVKDILYEHNWKICNDSKYVEFSNCRKMLFIRGVYEDKSRKPYLYNVHGKLSDNFQLFINKLCDYYDNEGLELSVLRFKDPALLIQFNRKRKIDQINRLENGR